MYFEMEGAAVDEVLRKKTKNFPKGGSFGGKIANPEAVAVLMYGSAREERRKGIK